MNGEEVRKRKKDRKKIIILTREEEEDPQKIPMIKVIVIFLPILHLAKAPPLRRLVEREI